MSKSSEKVFKNLDPAIINDTSHWFWVREGYSTLNIITWAVLCEEFWDIRIWVYLVFAYPLILIFGIPVVTLFYKKQAVKLMEKGSSLTMYNKKNIEYFTILALLQNKDYEV